MHFNEVGLSYNYKKTPTRSTESPPDCALALLRRAYSLCLARFFALESSAAFVGRTPDDFLPPTLDEDTAAPTEDLIRFPPPPLARPPAKAKLAPAPDPADPESAARNVEAEMDVDEELPEFAAARCAPSFAMTFEREMRGRRDGCLFTPMESLVPSVPKPGDLMLPTALLALMLA